MRIGFVGVGKWGQKLASSFRACGAEIVAHDRRTPSMSEPRWGSTEGFPEAQAEFDRQRELWGRYYRWQAQLADKSIDAIVAVAPPEITTEVALACAAAGKPVMATKPLFDHPASLRAPFYVDLWRLWSADYQRLRAGFLGDVIGGVARPDGAPFVIALYGSGPYRSFPGALDYGPHVLAMMLDISGRDGFTVTSAQRIERDGGEHFSVEANWSACGIGGCFQASFGNGATGAVRAFGQLGAMVFEESSRIGSEEKSAVLQRFCQSFLDDISEGFVDTRLLELSRRGMEELRKIREMATPSAKSAVSHHAV